MKLTILFFLAGLLQVSARTTAQTVTYSGKSVTLTTVFSAIKKQTGYLFFYRNEDLSATTPVTVQLHHTPLSQALEQTLAGQPLTFTIQGNTIFITSKPVPVVQVNAPPVTGVHGRITDSVGNPLSGASVTIKGTHRGTVTDAKGEFSLKEGRPGVVILITFTGYAPKEYTIPNENSQMFFVRLSRSSDPLDDVQVVAYGTNTRRFSVGSVSTVSSADIEQQPVTNPLLALEGRIAGLTVTQNSGAPGALAQVQIRGQNTLISGLGQTSTTGSSLSIINTSGNTPFDQPLFIIDGVPFATGNNNIGLLPSLGGSNTNIANSGWSAFNSINPSDIESISVLKDADATSIYGSQGANGVIVVTTKKGRPGKTNLDIRVNTGPNKITRTYPMLNTQQYVAMRREAAMMDGLDLNNVNYQSSFPDIFVFDTTRNTNWLHRFFGGTANNTDAHASLSGGTPGSTFLLSGGYTHTSYNFPGNFADNRATMHSSYHHNSTDHKLNVDFGTDFSYEHNVSPESSSAGLVSMMPPNLPELKDAHGNLIWSYKGVSLTNFQPYGYLKQPSGAQTYLLNTNFRVAYQIVRGLNASVNIGYNKTNSKQTLQVPLSSQAPGLASSAQFAYSDYQTVNIEPQIDYKTTIGRGTLSALVGGTYKSTISQSTIEQGTTYSNDALLRSIDGASSVMAYDGYQIYKYAGGFARLGYIYEQKYILSLTGRRDGSSNFGPGNQFGSFGSVGAGWIFSEEKAFKETLPFISFGKISGNYGTTGSDGVTSYNFQDFWKLASTAIPTFQGTRGYTPVNLYNPNYSWASKTSINIGLDLGFLHDRILVNGTWYRNRTSNQLVNYFLPSQTGFLSVVQNLNATLQDGGWEVSLNTVNISTKKFRWTSTFNIYGNRNKLIRFPNLLNSTYASVYAIGRSTSTQMGFKYAGINDSTGVFQFYDSKGGKTATPKGTASELGGDLSPVIDLQPKFEGGFGNTFSYGGFSLTAFFHFKKWTGKNYLSAIYSQVVPGLEYNLPSIALNHWRQKGDHAPMERLTTESSSLGAQAYRAASYFISSTGAYSDASFIRLQTLALSYTLPPTWLKKSGMKNASVYVNAQNLFTITSYKLGDPETPGSLYGIPMQRTIMGGVSLTF